MTIFYFITVEGPNGVGGHFHSLNQVSLQMGSIHEVKIFSFGRKVSPVLAQNPYFEEHISYSRGILNLFRINRLLSERIKKDSPQLLHCFDTSSLNRLLLTPATRKLPLVLNKCGGKNPMRKNYQHADAIVCFSKENYKWFKKCTYYDDKDLYLIPNRVRELALISEENRKEKKTPGKITFVRISRLGGAYEKTLSDTYNLIEELSQFLPVELVVIGRIQDAQRFRALQDDARKRKLPVRYITDERASSGADFLYLADFVIGTGRSFMESVSLGIPTLTPAANHHHPVLVNRKNFDGFFSTNFSERNRADRASIKNNLQEIRKLVDSKQAYESASRDSKEMFNEYFSTEGIISKYSKMYENVLSKSGTINRLTQLKKNFPYLIKQILHN